MESGLLLRTCFVRYSYLEEAHRISQWQKDRQSRNRHVPPEAAEAAVAETAMPSGGCLDMADLAEQEGPAR